MRRAEIRLGVAPEAARRALLGVVLAITAASAVAQVFAFPLDTPRGYGWVRLIDANQESSIGTWYSAVALLACALLLGIISLASRRTDPRNTPRWIFLAAIFLLASIDEIAEFHEALSETLDHYVHGKGALEHPWVVPGAIAVVAVAVAYRRFVLELAPRVRGLLILGAAVYVAGAVGLETVQGLVEDVGDGFVSGLVGVGEELAEMAGVVFIIEGLLVEVANAASIAIEFRESARL